MLHTCLTVSSFMPSLLQSIANLEAVQEETYRKSLLHQVASCQPPPRLSTARRQWQQLFQRFLSVLPAFFFLPRSTLFARQVLVCSQVWWDLKEGPGDPRTGEYLGGVGLEGNQRTLKEMRNCCERAISECGDEECYCECTDSLTDCLRVCFIGNANMISSTVLRIV